MSGDEMQALLTFLWRHLLHDNPEDGPTVYAETSQATLSCVS